jgi:hypothetical protein
LEDGEYHEENIYNGKSSFGVIVECIAEGEGQVNVTWDNGNNEIYRLGNVSGYDLYMAKDVVD